MESGSYQTENVSGASMTKVTLSRLTKYTNYSVEVAAVASAGPGIFSGLTNDTSKSLDCDNTVCD